MLLFCSGADDLPSPVNQHQVAMKIYTRTGDAGETGLLGGLRVSKSHQVIEVCGTLDETNCWLGLVRSEQIDVSMDQLIEQIQNDLFDIGSMIAASMSDSDSVAQISTDRVAELESAIDHWDATVPPLQAFILPSGAQSGCRLHMSRAVCRRAERQLVSLVELLDGSQLTTESVYLNRLSDLLFVLARAVNQSEGRAETKWRANRERSPD